ncbi:hypothetical protein BLNAU_21726 [Blattamonas nauphoetae]|uniref:Uncharacterized protein n=1 Tax=Blattamonas nauphoetae TaxID=2049346 RepID=A0ABQ9WVK3_9EUKA|nr:hypothetical protein BLNAU_21726 [Blattamonas nauphoetae]
MSVHPSKRPYSGYDPLSSQRSSYSQSGFDFSTEKSLNQSQRPSFLSQPPPTHPPSFVSRPNVQYTSTQSQSFSQPPLTQYPPSQSQQFSSSQSTQPSSTRSGLSEIKTNETLTTLTVNEAVSVKINADRTCSLLSSHTKQERPITTVELIGLIGNVKYDVAGGGNGSVLLTVMDDLIGEGVKVLAWQQNHPNFPFGSGKRCRFIGTFQLFQHEKVLKTFWVNEIGRDEYENLSQIAFSNGKESSMNCHNKANFTHLRTQSKKMQMEEERCGQMERDNAILLAKMSKIAKGKGDVDNTEPNRHGKESMNIHVRTLEQDKIAAENQAIVTRIRSRRPNIQHKQFDDDWKETQRLIESISLYPPPNQSQAMHPTVTQKLGAYGASPTRRSTSSGRRGGTGRSGSGSRRRTGRSPDKLSTRRSQKGNKGKRGKGQDDENGGLRKETMRTEEEDNQIKDKTENEEGNDDEKPKEEDDQDQLGYGGEEDGEGKEGEEQEAETVPEISQ